MDRKRLEIALAEVKRWVRTQPHMPLAAAEDEDILNAFVHGFGCFHSLAKLKLDAYYTFRGQYRRPFFDDRDPKRIKWYSVTKYMMLEDKTAEGDYVLLALLPRDEKQRYYSAEESAKLLLMLLDSYIRQHGGPMLSLYVIVDAANLCQYIAEKHTPSHSSSLNLILEAYPVRIRQVISFNVKPDTAHLCNELHKDFFNEENLQTSLVETNHLALAKYLQLAILPTDYHQGTSLPVKALWNGVQQRLERERAWFISHGSQATDESLRT